MSCITYSEIKLVGPQIPPRIRSLHDHFLPLHRARRKRQLVARTTPRRLGPARDSRRCEAVAQRVGDGPRRLVGAHIARAGVAPGCCVVVRERVVLRVARCHGVGAAG